MTIGITGTEALSLLGKKVHSITMQNYCFTNKAVMRRLSRLMNENKEKWGQAWRLHDLNAEPQPDLALHITVTIRRLKEHSVALTWLMPFGCTMEKAHIAKGSTLFQHAFCSRLDCDRVDYRTGLVYPDPKKLRSTSIDS